MNLYNNKIGEKMKILLIIPAYNEEENILNVCNIIKYYNKNAEQKLDYIVINDGSKDSTLKYWKTIILIISI